MKKRTVHTVRFFSCMFFPGMVKLSMMILIYTGGGL